MPATNLDGVLVNQGKGKVRRPRHSRSVEIDQVQPYQWVLEYVFRTDMNLPGVCPKRAPG